MKGAWTLVVAVLLALASTGGGTAFEVSPVSMDLSLMAAMDLDNETCPAGEERCLEDDMCCGGLNACNKHDECYHKQGVMPFHYLDAITLSLCFLGTIAAVMGGIGGGGLFVPLLVLIDNMPAGMAVPLSKAMILGAAIISVTLEARKRVNDKPTINMAVVALIQPMTLCGTIVGVFMNVLLPDAVILVLLTLVLGLSAYTTIKKAYKVYRKEKMKLMDGRIAKDEIQLVERKRDNGDDGSEDGALGNSNDDDEDHRQTTGDDSDDGGDTMYAEDAGNDNLIAYTGLLEKESRFGFRYLALVVGVWVAILMLAIIKQLVGCDGPAMSEKYQWLFWILALVPIPLAVVVTIQVARKLRREYMLKSRCGHAFLKTDFIFNRRNTFLFPAASLIAGILAGMVGIGGGMVIGPLLLNMSEESDPRITTAISGMMVLFTSSATTIQFIVLGTLAWQYALMLAGVCTIGSLIAKCALQPMIERAGKRSYMLICLGVIIFVSCVLTCVVGIQKLATSGGEITGVSIDKLCKGGH